MLTADRQLAAPRSVRLGQGLLCFEWREEKHSGENILYEIAHPRRARSDLWRRFASLEHARDERIRSFAETWGSLNGKQKEIIELQDWAEKWSMKKKGKLTISDENEIKRVLDKLRSVD